MKTAASVLLALFLFDVCPLLAESHLVDDSFVDTAPKFRFRTKFPRKFIDDENQMVLISRETDIPPKIDGILDDACWKMADHTKSAWVQMKSKIPSRKQTVLYVSHDATHVYFAYVAEEPELRAVHMKSKRPKLQPGENPHGRWELVTVYYGDAGEMFLELGGVGGEGRIYQFIFNIYPEVLFDSATLTDRTWESGMIMQGSFGAKRWIVEMAISLDRFTHKNFVYRGPPLRGEIWGLRVVRDGRTPKMGQDRMFSTWTYNPVMKWHIPYPTGILVFEHRNILRNGGFNEDFNDDQRPDFWTLAVSDKSIESTLTFDKKLGRALLETKHVQTDQAVQVVQPIKLRENTFYRLTAKIRPPEGKAKVYLGVSRPLVQEVIEPVPDGGFVTKELDFYTEPGQTSTVVFLQVKDSDGRIEIDELKAEQLIYGVEKGLQCLTGNSPREDLNIEVPGEYTYLEPDSDNEQFPYEKRWTEYWINGIPDEGGTTGGIPFKKGSLTHMDRKLIEWPTKDHILTKMYPKGHDIVFDLKKNYMVNRIDVLPIGTIENVHIWVKPDKTDKYILTYKLNGAGVLNPPGPVMMAKARTVDSVCRYVKINYLEYGKSGGGLAFIRVWGRPLTDGEPVVVKRFQWKRGIVVNPKPVPQFERLREPFVIPQPQEVRYTDEPFVLKDGLKVVVGDIARFSNGSGGTMGKGMAIGRQIVEELAERFRIRAVLVEEKKLGGEPPAGSIVIGEPENSPLVGRLAKVAGWSITSESPGEQGYRMRISPQGVLIAGYDQAGTFYGVQSLMQLTHFRANGSAAAQGCEILDWPYMNYRTPFYYISKAGLIPKYKRMLKALARLKINTVLCHLRVTPGQTNPGSRSFGFEEARELQRFAGEHFIELEAYYVGRASGMDTYERADDEDYEHLAKRGNIARANGCPSNPKLYDGLFGNIDRTADVLPVTRINIGMDEMGHEAQGARWQADRRCLIREMTGGELFGEMCVRLYDKIRSRNRKTDVLDTMLTKYGNDYYGMSDAYPWLPKDMGIEMWKGKTGDKGSNPEYGIDRFERAFGINNTGREYGGEVNENYNLQTKRRMWGRHLATWGIGDTEATQLGLMGKGRQVGYNMDHLVVFAEQTWAPQKPGTLSLEFAQRMGTTILRMNEISEGRRYPSLRSDRRPSFFTVPMARNCNWSHIDPLPADEKDWLDWGKNYDLSLLPMGKIEFDGVPFEILDPQQNAGRSFIFLSNPVERDRTLPLPSTSGPIRIGRKAASLMFLRAHADSGHAPVYRITYEGGEYLSAAIPILAGASDAHAWNSSNGYARHNRIKPQPTTTNEHPMCRAFTFIARPAWMGHTPSGDEITIYAHEWVNPYPEKTIEAVTVWWPQVRTGSWKEALFAITGIEPDEVDVSFWSRRERLPLQKPGAVSIGNSRALLSNGTFDESKRVYQSAEGKVIAKFKVDGLYSRRMGTIFEDKDNRVEFGLILSKEYQVQIEFTNPQPVTKVLVRPGYHWVQTRPHPHSGTHHYLHIDYVLEVSSDGQSWQTLAEVIGACGEDGDRVHRVPTAITRFLRLRLSGGNYLEDYERSYPALSGLQVYKN